MQLEVITPDKVLYKGEVDFVKLPGIGGSFGVLENHAPLISALTAGVVEVEQPVGFNQKFDDMTGEFVTDIAKDQKFSFDIKGGVIEVKDNKVILLAD